VWCLLFKSRPVELMLRAGNGFRAGVLQLVTISARLRHFLSARCLHACAYVCPVRFLSLTLSLLLSRSAAVAAPLQENLKELLGDDWTPARVAAMMTEADTKGDGRIGACLRVPDVCEAAAELDA
jgi:hypothetical protein